MLVVTTNPIAINITRISVFPTTIKSAILFFNRLFMAGRRLLPEEMGPN